MRPRLDGRTTALAALCLATVPTLVWSCATGRVGCLAAVAGSSVACYAGFTPVHEAAHGNVSRWPWLNDAIGHLCAALLLGALGPYRFLHLEHHRHTDAPGQDPDLWSAGRWPLLRWATQDLGYLRFYASRWATRPRWERYELLLSGGLYAGVLLGSAIAGPRVLVAVLAGWVVPARIALFALAALFAWWPHAPGAPVRTARWLNVLLLGQGYHLVHHRHPRVPFYALAVKASTARAAASRPLRTGGSPRNGTSRSSAPATCPTSSSAASGRCTHASRSRI